MVLSANSHSGVDGRLDSYCRFGSSERARFGERRSGPHWACEKPRRSRWCELARQGHEEHNTGGGLEVSIGPELRFWGRRYSASAESTKEAWDARLPGFQTTGGSRELACLKVESVHLNVPS